MSIIDTWKKIKGQTVNGSERDPTNIIIHIEGGLIQHTISDRPLKVCILEEDRGAMDISDFELIELFPSEGKKLYYVISKFPNEINPERVESVMRQINW